MIGDSHVTAAVRAWSSHQPVVADHTADSALEDALAVIRDSTQGGLNLPNADGDTALHLACAAVGNGQAAAAAAATAAKRREKEAAAAAAKIAATAASAGAWPRTISPERIAGSSTRGSVHSSSPPVKVPHRSTNASIVAGSNAGSFLSRPTTTALHVDPDIRVGGSTEAPPAPPKAVKGRERVIDALLRRGANIGALNKAGQAPVECSRSAQDTEAAMAVIAALRESQELPSVAPLFASRLMKVCERRQGSVTFSSISRSSLYFLYDGAVFVWNADTDVEHVVYDPRSMVPQVQAAKTDLGKFLRRKSLVARGVADPDFEHNDEQTLRLRVESLESTVRFVRSFVVTHQAKSAERIEWVLCDEGTCVAVRFDLQGSVRLVHNSGAGMGMSHRRRSLVCGAQGVQTAVGQRPDIVVRKSPIRFSTAAVNPDGTPMAAPPVVDNILPAATGAAGSGSPPKHTGSPIFGTASSSSPTKGTAAAAAAAAAAATQNATDPYLNRRIAKNAIPLCVVDPASGTIAYVVAAPEPKLRQQQGSSDDDEEDPRPFDASASYRASALPPRASQTLSVHGAASPFLTDSRRPSHPRSQRSSVSSPATLELVQPAAGAEATAVSPSAEGTPVPGSARSQNNALDVPSAWGGKMDGYTAFGSGSASPPPAHVSPPTPDTPLRFTIGRGGLTQEGTPLSMSAEGVPGPVVTSGASSTAAPDLYTTRPTVRVVRLDAMVPKTGFDGAMESLAFSTTRMPFSECSVADVTCIEQTGAPVPDYPIGIEQTSVGLYIVGFQSGTFVLYDKGAVEADRELKFSPTPSRDALLGRLPFQWSLASLTTPCRPPIESISCCVRIVQATAASALRPWRPATLVQVSRFIEVFEVRPETLTETSLGCPVTAVPQYRLGPTPMRASVFHVTFSPQSSHVHLLLQRDKRQEVAVLDLISGICRMICRLPRPSSLRFLPSHSQQDDSGNTQHLPTLRFAMSRDGELLLRYNVAMQVMTLYRFDDVMNHPRVSFTPWAVARRPRAVVDPTVVIDAAAVDDDEEPPARHFLVIRAHSGDAPDKSDTLVAALTVFCRIARVHTGFVAAPATIITPDSVPPAANHGPATVAEFTSTLEATRCSIAVQRALAMHKGWAKHQLGRVASVQYGDKPRHDRHASEFVWRGPRCNTYVVMASDAEDAGNIADRHHRHLGRTGDDGTFGVCVATHPVCHQLAPYTPIVCESPVCFVDSGECVVFVPQELTGRL